MKVARRPGVTGRAAAIPQAMAAVVAVLQALPNRGTQLGYWVSRSLRRDAYVDFAFDDAPSAPSLFVNHGHDEPGGAAISLHCINPSTSLRLLRFRNRAASGHSGIATA